MTICNVLSTMTIGENTAIVVDGSGKLFKNGIGILDDNGKPFEVLSVGLECAKAENILDKTSLLLKGSFSSKKVYI